MERGKKKLLVTAVALVLVLAAAAAAYRMLSADTAPDMQLAAGPSQEEVSGQEEEADAAGGEEPETAQDGAAAAEDEADRAKDGEAGAAEDGGQAGEEETELMTAPDFAMQDYEGMTVQLSDLFGTPIVMNFWSSGCGPCKMEMPDFQAASEELEDEVLFVMVDSIGVFGETVESGKAYVEEQGFTFPVFFDVDQEGISTYGITSFPTTFFLNENGEIVAYGQGMMSAETLEQGISMILP